MSKRSQGERDWGGAIRTVVFYVLFYLYLWLHVDLRLIYHGGGFITNYPVFFRGRAFFEQFTHYPGGIAEYAAAFGAQLFYYSWAGALVVTILAWLLGLCIGFFLRASNGAGLRSLRFVPAILLLAVYSRYTYHFTSVFVLLIAFSFSGLYMRTVSGRTLRDAACYVALSPILYYIAGGGFLMFALTCAIYEFLVRRRRQIGVLCLLSGFLIPYIGGVIFFEVSIINAYSELLPFSWRNAGRPSHEDTVLLIYALYALAPATILGLGLWRRLFTAASEDTDSEGAAAGKKEKAKHPKLAARIRSFYTNSPKFRWIVQSLALFFVASGAVAVCYDGERRIEFQVVYYASEEMWEQLLRSTRRHPANHRVANTVNRALYHTGRLGYDMFSYPQHAAGFMLTDEKFKAAHWDRFDVRIELGLVSMAENDLAECLAMYGWRPAVLKGLARARMVNGNIGSARIYLGALAKTLFHADWANDYLGRLEVDPRLSKDKEIQRLRSLLVERDESKVFSDNEYALTALLEKNPRNRMAFEYLMSWYLLTRQMDKFVDNLKRLNDLGYSEMPLTYDEAIFIYAYETGKTVELEGDWGSPKSAQRIQDFSRIFTRYGRNKNAALPELAAKYGSSYFFYNLYGFSGVKN